MYHKTVLDNGVRIISEQLEHFQSVCLGIWVNVGSRDEEQKENGISHFIEHMIFRGTSNRSSFQIAKELDAIGGLSNAFTGKEHTCFHAKVLGKHFRVCGDILSDIFLSSTFDLDNLERERQVILQEISMVEDTPDENVHTLFNRLFWPDHPIGLPVLGTGPSVSVIKREDILTYISKFYTPDRVLLVAAGNIDHDSMVSHFEPRFCELKSASTTFLRSRPCSNHGLSSHHKNLEQVQICMGGEAPSLSSEWRFPCAILNTILGGNMSSRLFQEIRENLGLAYSVYSFHSPFLDTGVLGVSVATDCHNVNPVLASIQKEIGKIIRGELSESDLDAAKEHLIGGIHLSSESVENRMMRIAKNELIFERYVSHEELIAQLEKVKLDEVVEMTREIFQRGKLCLTTLGPINQEDLDLTCLDFNGS